MIRAFEHRSSFPIALGLLAGVALGSSVATAGIHTWDVKEVFSNASGTIQYVELIERQTAGVGAETGVANSSITSNTRSQSWTGVTVPAPTGQKSFLIASASFAALAGAPTPDVIIPVGSMPFFNPAGDTITFAGCIDACTFGAVPTNGTNSLDRDSGSVTNSPKNRNGATGTVNANPAPVPSVSFWMAAGLLSSLAAMGAWTLRRRAGAIG
ncbi:MAG: hypothetical protein IPK00_06205 [Deltaproteobacteria bacterium]|nr:hypothetical protein [Deltaproteobacteria bacterium]